MIEIVIIFLFAIIFSAFGTIVGFGGGIFMIPFLLVFFQIPLNIVAGSVILALLPSSLISTVFNLRTKKIDFLAGVALEVPTIVGTIFGTLLISFLPIYILEIAFSFFISLIGVYTYRKGYKENIKPGKNHIFFKLNKVGPRVIKKTETGAYRISFFMAVCLGMMAGMMAGMFGVGGGFLKTPIMINVFSIPPTVATATSLFMIVFTSLTGSVSHYFLGNINFTSAVPIVVGFVLGSFAGNHLNLKLSENFLTKLMGIGLVFAGFSVLVNTIVIR